MYMGPNRFELVQYLLKQGARFDSVTHNGTSILMSACANEDADLRVLKLLIEKTTRDEINRKIRPQTNQWRAIYTMAKIACKSGLNRGVLMRCLYERLGRTALHYAVRRGDFHCVQLLLKNGAEVSIKDDMGLSPKNLCSNFPELRELLRNSNTLRQFGSFSKISTDVIMKEKHDDAPFERSLSRAASGFAF